MVATDATLRPFEYIDEDTKQIEGLEIDIFKAIAEKADLKYEIKNVSYDLLIAGIKEGEYDCAISSIIITEELKKDMLFSDPYLPAGQVIVVQADNSVITGKETLQGKVAVHEGTPGELEVEKVPAATHSFMMNSISLLRTCWMEKWMPWSAIIR